MIYNIYFIINKMSIFILTSNNPHYNWVYKPRQGDVNSQIIISKYIDNIKYIYNFNADVAEDNMASISSRIDELLQIPLHYKYKRHIINSNEIHIIQLEHTYTRYITNTSNISVYIEP